MKLKLYKGEEQTEAQLKAAWLAALRSGKYKQTTGALRNEANEYCCLGVLCDIVDHNAWRIVEGEDYYSYEDKEVAFLPVSVENTLSGIAHHTSTLMKMNDKLNQSFEAIADWIEANLTVKEAK